MTDDERIAHDIVCVVKYGSPGGSVSGGDVSRVLSHLRNVGILKRKPKLVPPVIKLKLPVT